MMRIRSATPGDVPAMMALEAHAVTAAHWRGEYYLRIFADDAPRRAALVVEVGGQVSGFLVALCAGPEWEIENIAIAAPARRRGLGTRLLGEFLDQARAAGASSVWLEVRESNRAARALYEKWAFIESGRRPAYYPDPPEDALIYRFSLYAPLPANPAKSARIRPKKRD
jgi:ribosomal-protein-alanine N-acetyltransferase